MVRAATHVSDASRAPREDPPVPCGARVRPVSPGPHGKERSNAFAADNSTEWTGGTRNLASETGLAIAAVR